MCNLQTSDGNLVVADGSEASSHPVVLARSKTARGAELVGSNGKNDNLFKNLPASVQLKEKGLELENSTNKGGRNQHKGSFEHPGDDQDSKNDKDGYVPVLPRESLTLSEQVRYSNMDFLHPVIYCFLTKFHVFCHLTQSGEIFC